MHISSSWGALHPSLLIFPSHELARAGTGLLSIALSPLVRRYTVTDIPDMLPLIRKNLAMNFSGDDTNVVVAQLDWTLLHSTPASHRSRVFPLPGPDEAEAVDLVLVVDCVFNPALLPALHSTMEYIAGHGTPVLV